MKYLDIDFVCGGGRPLITKVNFSSKYRNMKIFCLFLCHIWQFVSFKEFFHFISVTEFIAIKFFLLICNYPFPVGRICSDTLSFLPDIGILLVFCLLFSFSEGYQFYQSFQRTSFWFFFFYLDRCIFKDRVQPLPFRSFR